MTRVLEQCKIICRPCAANRGVGGVVARTRCAFYNQKLFSRKEDKRTKGIKKNEIKQVRTVTIGGRWVDFGLNFAITMGILAVMLYFLPGVLAKYLPGGKLPGAQVEPIRISLQPYLTRPVVIPAEEVLVGEMETAHRVTPRYDLEMPEGLWIMSESAGIRAPIFTNSSTDDVEAVNTILERGVYLYPEYDNIGWSGRTTVLAGHYMNMVVKKRRAEESFQNLEKLQVGDRVQLVDKYQVWTYEIYKIEQATQITEENPDLLMYSCIWWWDSRLRRFVYGRIVEPTP